MDRAVPKVNSTRAELLAPRIATTLKKKLICTSQLRVESEQPMLKYFFGKEEKFNIVFLKKDEIEEKYVMVYINIFVIT